MHEIVAENKLKTDKLNFKIQQQATKIRKCEDDNEQIQRHIDQRREERENKDELLKQLKREIEIQKKRVELSGQDLDRVKDDMAMIKKQI